jgi:hypothetical protein
MTLGLASEVEADRPVPIIVSMFCTTTMERSFIVVLLTMILLGCGGSSHSPVPAGFVNQTHHSDAELQALWAEAQQSVAQQIDLNPLQQLSSHVSPETRPGDARALSVEPHLLLVAAEPDVSSGVLFAVTGQHRSDPTGMIACPHPCNVRYATAYSLYQPEVTRYASSWEFAGDSFSVILEYEFENHILHALGYDMTWR